MTTREIKAWAVVHKDGEIGESISSSFAIFSSEKVAERNARILNGNVHEVSITYTT